MKQRLYLYRKNGNGLELYVNEISTVDGLKALEESDKIRLISIGATSYKNYGFATEKEFPEFDEPSKLIDFLNHAGEIGLIHFEVEIVGKGKMTSHDDGECHFMLENKKDGLGILKKIAPDFQSDFVVSTLLNNDGIYLCISKDNEVTKFSTFDEYLKKTAHKS